MCAIPSRRDSCTVMTVWQDDGFHLSWTAFKYHCRCHCAEEPFGFQSQSGPSRIIANCQLAVRLHLNVPLNSFLGIKKCDILLYITAVNILYLKVQSLILNVVFPHKGKMLKADYKALLTNIGNHLVQLHNEKYFLHCCLYERANDTQSKTILQVVPDFVKKMREGAFIHLFIQCWVNCWRWCSDHCQLEICRIVDYFHTTDFRLTSIHCLSNPTMNKNIFVSDPFTKWKITDVGFMWMLHSRVVW